MSYGVTFQKTFVVLSKYILLFVFERSKFELWKVKDHRLILKVTFQISNIKFMTAQLCICYGIPHSRQSDIAKLNGFSLTTELIANVYF